MNKKAIAWFGILLLLAVAVFILLPFGKTSLGGSGTAEDPFIITTCLELNETRNNLTAYYKLGNNINCSDTVNWNGGKGFEPIGHFEEEWAEFPFTGVFDGDGYTISDLYMNWNNSPNIFVGGLFGFIENASIMNVGIVNANITILHDEWGGVGILVGTAGYGILNSTIYNSFSTGAVKGYLTVGGLVGEGNCENCYSRAVVEGNDSVGGLVGRKATSRNILNSYSTGNVTGAINIGGLIGLQYPGGTVTNSFWDNQTSGQSTSDGGIGKTTTQMKDFDTFNDVGWDIIKIGDYVNETWFIDDGNDYPKLGWEWIDTTPPQVSFTSPTPQNNTYRAVNYSGTINVTIDETDLDEVKFNWNGTNYTIYNDSLVLMMNFENLSALGENSTYFKDVSGASNDGSCSVCPVYTSSGKYGGAYEFDAVDNISLGNDTSLYPYDHDFSVTVWVKVNGDNNFIIGNKAEAGSPRWSIWYFYDTDPAQQVLNLYFEPTSLDLYGTTVINDNKWHHLAMVIDATNNKVYGYVNGNKEIDNTFTLNINDTNDVTLGYRGPLTDAGLTGLMDEVRIWNRSLSATEVKQHYYSNLKKLNSTRWEFETNQTSLADGVYTYYASVIDSADNTNSTEKRTLNIDTIYPLISFVSPTEASGATISKNYTYVNVSVSDANNVSSFINWNNSLVGYWNFNDATATDNSTYGNDGTVNGSTWTSSGKFGGAYNFDGVDDSINCSNDSSLNINDTFTLAAWVKLLVIPPSSSDIITKSAADWSKYWYIDIDTGSRAVFDVYDGTNSAHLVGGSLVVNLWHYIAVVRNGSSIFKLYVDGNQVDGGTAYSIKDITSIADVYIGGNPVENDFYFNGTIDEVRVWNRALSAEEINASYNTGLYRLYHNFTGLADGSYSYYAQTIDLAGNINQTETRTLKIFTGVVEPPTPPISPGAPGISPEAIRIEYLCNQTFHFRIQHISNSKLEYSEEDLTILQNKITKESGFISKTDLKTYIDQYIYLCEINKDYLCSKFYFFNSKHLKDNAIEYSEEEIRNLKEKIYNETLIDIPQNTIDSYTNKDYFEQNCYALPKQEPKKEEPPTPLQEYIKKACGFELSEDIEIIIPFTTATLKIGAYIPLPSIFIGEGIGCKTAKVLTYIFKLAEDNGRIYIKGLRIWVLVALGILTALFFFIRWLLRSPEAGEK